MARSYLPIAALLLGSAFLLFAGGINGLILPVRGTQEGFSAFALGLLGTGWAVGYITGCYVASHLVAKVGHVRSFSVMAALAAITILLSLLLIDPWAWVPLRAISGFCFAGAAMIVESWLSDRVDAKSRGRVFGVYTMVNLTATTGGQLALTVGDVSGAGLFVAGAIFYCLSLIPTAISSSQTPAPLVTVRLDLASLWKNSPVAVFGVFCVGLSNSAFGTLSAVYAGRVGLELDAIALFASIPILCGALSQIPIGYLSDRMDRRKVLVGVALFALVVEAAFIILRPAQATGNLLLASGFGAAIYAMYPIILAHANDHAPAGTSIQTSGGLLMVFGLGSIAGPLIAGLAMGSLGAIGLFATSVVAHVLIIAFTLWRIRARAPVAEEAKGTFVFAPIARNATPETSALALGEEEVADGGRDRGQ